MIKDKKAKQTNKKTTHSNKNNKKSTGAISERARAYALRRFLNPTEQKKQSLLKCDYSKTVNPQQVERQPGFINAIEELKSLATISKCDPKSQLTFFQKMRDDVEIAPQPRIESGKEINRMLGYKAPEQIEVAQTTTQNVSILIGMIRKEGVSIGELLHQSRTNDTTIATTEYTVCDDNNDK